MRNIALSINVVEATLNGTIISGKGTFGKNNDPIEFTSSKFLENVIKPNATIVAVGMLTSNVVDNFTALSLKITQAGVVPTGTLINSISVLGRASADPVVSATKDNEDITKFSLAVKAGKDITNWYAIAAFGKTGEILKNFVVKGKEVALSGRIGLSTWKNKETGAQCSKLELTADSVTLISSKQ
ncbi:single-stranded DNA-binding protein [Chamaesiphon sp.]|uniref:single-stranded DNA-binding protein n=1 Tax=Chamaesiphon sp. TaxID=2814140 RepID=UPI0035944694